MDREDRPKRDAPISYRLPKGRRDDFFARVRNSGLPTNAFITAAIFGQAAPRGARVSSADSKMVALLLSQTARISDRLEEAGMVGGDAMLLDECRGELAEIRTMLMQALGRSP